MCEVGALAPWAAEPAVAPKPAPVPARSVRPARALAGRVDAHASTFARARGRNAARGGTACAPGAAPGRALAAAAGARSIRTLKRPSSPRRRCGSASSRSPRNPSSTMRCSNSDARSAAARTCSRQTMDGITRMPGSLASRPRHLRAQGQAARAARQAAPTPVFRAFSRARRRRESVPGTGKDRLPGTRHRAGMGWRASRRPSAGRRRRAPRSAESGARWR